MTEEEVYRDIKNITRNFKQAYEYGPSSLRWSVTSIIELLVKLIDDVKGLENNNSGHYLNFITYLKDRLDIEVREAENAWTALRKKNAPKAREPEYQRKIYKAIERLESDVSDFTN